MDTKTIASVLLVCLFSLMVIPGSASVTITSSTPQIITKGDVFSLEGTGAVNGTVALWIVGRNYINRQIIIPDSKGNYSLSINSVDTRQFTSGQYAFVIQDPGPNQKLDIEYRVADNGDIILQNQGKTFADIGARENLKASVVPFISAFSATAANPGADDLFSPHYFFVEDPSVGFDYSAGPGESLLPDVIATNRVALGGPTNIDPRDKLHAEIRDRSRGLLVASSDIPVEPGTTLNHWSWTPENVALPTGSYTVTIWRPNAFVNVSASAFFTVVPSSPGTTGPSGNATITLPWAGDPLLPLIILFGLALVIASILFTSRKR
nr:hypothetical protein [uncultured Methanoregula sp.]